MKKKAQSTLEYVILAVVTAAVAVIAYGWLAGGLNAQGRYTGGRLAGINSILTTADGYPVGYDKILTEPTH